MKSNRAILLNLCFWAAASALPAASLANPSPCESKTNFSLPTLKSRVIMLGDFHGTNEYPALAGAILCNLTKTGKMVIFGMEMSRNEQEGLTEYTSSIGDEASKRNLMRADTWTKDMQDGRGSQAMFELVDLVRRLRAQGAKIVVDAFSMGVEDLRAPIQDGDAYVPSGAEALKAAHIEYRLYQYPEAVYFAFVGSSHAAKEVLPYYEPMAYQLNKRIPVFSMLGTHAGGKAWYCSHPTDKNRCSAQDLRALRNGPSDTDYDAFIDLGWITMSPPALSLKN